MTYKCKSGRHAWLNRGDADKCCNGYRRVLVLGGGANQQMCAGVMIGRAWEPDVRGDIDEIFDMASNSN